MSAIALNATETKLLEYLAQNAGADIYNYGDAIDGRKLEKHGLVEIVAAQKKPRDPLKRHPYYGVKISDKGREWLADAGLLRRGLTHAW